MKSIWCPFTTWPSTTDTEAVEYASHSLETIFTTSFYTTFPVQLMFGKQRCKYEFKWIQSYSNCLGYWRHILYKPVVIKKDEINKRSFLNLSFANKGLDGINLIKDQFVPMISYAYTMHIATTIFNCKNVLHDFNIDDVKSKPSGCTCASSPLIYNPAGHVITIISERLSTRCVILYP